MAMVRGCFWFFSEAGVQVRWVGVLYAKFFRLASSSVLRMFFFSSFSRTCLGVSSKSIRRKTVARLRDEGVFLLPECENDLSAFRFVRYIDWKKELGKMIKDLITNGPCQMKMIRDPEIKIANIDAMNAILLGIPNDICNAVDACKTAQAMWARVKRLMQGTELISIGSYYQRFSKVINDLERHLILPTTIASNTKFLNSLQPEWKKYVMMVRQTNKIYEVDFDQLYDYLKQNEKINTGNVGYAGNAGRNTRRIVGNLRNTANTSNVQRATGNNGNVQRVLKTSANTGNVQMIKKVEAGIPLTDEENDLE
ncbi:hypothetical protein Tco_1174830 [Tanacetum coccineum]